MLCTDLTIVKDFGAFIEAKPLPCRSWKCQMCGPKRRRQLMAEAHGGNPNSLLTLTTSPQAGPTREARAVALAHAWRRLRRAIIRRHKLDALPFLCVFEATKRGEPHLHILLRAPFISQRWLSRWMATEIQSPIVDIRRITSSRMAAAYVAKYVGKNPHRFDGTKRYWRSKDWDQRPDEQADPTIRTADAIEVVRERFDDFCSHAPARGFTVALGDGNAILTRHAERRR